MPSKNSREAQWEGKPTKNIRRQPWRVESEPMRDGGEVSPAESARRERVAMLQRFIMQTAFRCP